MPFEVIKHVNPNDTKLEVVGTLDESGLLPNTTTARIIRLDLAQVKGINSIGVRNFIHWGDIHKEVSSIRLENCPSIFVKNFSLINGFLKDNMSVISFMVPLYSIETNESADVKMIRDRDFSSDGRMQVPLLNDSEGKPMALDVDEIYFRFLKK
jgi:hypothetical protein